MTADPVLPRPRAIPTHESQAHMTNTDPRIRQLAEHLHRITREKADTLPAWTDLSLPERERVTAEAGLWLHAAVEAGIAPPSEPPAVEESEACGKCKQPFDPIDTRFDGNARYHLTPYCRSCVDRCHDTEIADHRCVICA